MHAEWGKVVEVQAMGSRGLFKHHGQEVWEQLAAEMGGEFEKHTSWKRDRIHARVAGWTVTLDIHSEAGYRSEAMHTRFRGAHLGGSGLRFEIYHHGIFDGVARLLGSHIVPIDDAAFDRMFTIKATDADKIRELLKNDRIRELMMTEPEINVQLRDSGDWFAEDHPDGVDEIVLEVEGEVKSQQRIERLFRLFAEILHAAGEIDPG